MILVSSCLCGINCRYDGNNNAIEAIVEMVKKGEATPVCPEVFAGMPIPRACCEIQEESNGERYVRTASGEDFTEAFKEGAQKTLEIAKTLEVKVAILKSKSPSCGFGEIYDGTFTGATKKGKGFTAELLERNGIKVFNEFEFYLS